jgi:hypothetical protein
MSQVIAIYRSDLREREDTVKKLIVVALLLASTTALCEKKKKSPPTVTVRAFSYTTSRVVPHVISPAPIFVWPSSSARTQVTISDHPGQTFVIESSDTYLEPGGTYEGQWGKHEKYLKVLCVANKGYAWEKGKLQYVKFKVVGRGVQ